MNIWVDLVNSPHVNFFAGIIKELRTDHDTLLTCRPLANTKELLDLSTEFVREQMRAAKRKGPDQELMEKGKKADELIKQTVLGNNGY